MEADGGRLEDLRVQADPQQGPQGPRDGRRDGSSVRFTNSSNIFVLKHEEEEIDNMHFTRVYKDRRNSRVLSHSSKYLCACIFHDLNTCFDLLDRY